MKYRTVFLIGILLVFALSNCKTTEETTEIIVIDDPALVTSDDMMIINIIKGKSYNYPTFVIWAEDMDGNYLKTVFITQAYASGIFGHKMIGDTMWVNEAGSSYQPAALPYWTNKKGFIENKYLIPTPEHPYIDAYSGATPTDNFSFKTVSGTKQSQYRILLEINQTWDWNEYWTNNKYPDSPAYKHSSQPSLIYEVTINNEDSDFFMNPAGHGDPKGESGRLFTDISTLTTAREILGSVKIEIK